MAITLNNGFKMPMVGFGVWRVEGKDMRDLIANAIKIGYRHFDCACTFSHQNLIFFVFYEVGRRLYGSITCRLVGNSISFVLSIITCKSETIFELVLLD